MQIKTIWSRAVEVLGTNYALTPLSQEPGAAVADTHDGLHMGEKNEDEAVQQGGGGSP